MSGQQQATGAAKVDDLKEVLRLAKEIFGLVGDSANHTGQMMNGMDHLRDAINGVDKGVLGMSGKLDIVMDELKQLERKVESVDKKVDGLRDDVRKSVIDELVNQRQTIEAILSTVQRPLKFKADGAFEATIQSRIGEEVRASMRTFENAMAGNVYAATEAYMKQNPQKQPAGSGIVPILAFVAAAASVAQVVMTYYAAQNYVPPEINARVNGVLIPQQPVAPTALRTSGPVRMTA